MRRSPAEVDAELYLRRTKALESDIERWRRMVGAIYDELASSRHGLDLSGTRIELQRVADEMAEALKGLSNG